MAWTYLLTYALRFREGTGIESPPSRRGSVHAEVCLCVGSQVVQIVDPAGDGEDEVEKVGGEMDAEVSTVVKGEADKPADGLELVLCEGRAGIDGDVPRL